jgi:DNA-binding CsgD family transcriptional regulator
MSRLSWFLVQNSEAERYGLAAVEALETLTPGHELAMAYGNLSHLRMLECDNAQAVRWGERAIELAEGIQDIEALSYTLNNVGLARLQDGDQAGLAQLERSLHLALGHGYEEHVARAYANLATIKVAQRAYAQAGEYLEKGLAYCAERDLGSWEHCLWGQQARARLDQGDWAAADEDATAILRVPWASGTNSIPALLVLGLVRVRRGDPGTEMVLDEVRDLALNSGSLDYVLSAAAIRAEWRWLQGDLDQCVAESRSYLRLALIEAFPWHIGELLFWLWRGGGLNDVPPKTPALFAAQIAGDWHTAEALWEQIGCPYERGLALMDGDEAAQRQALEIFERLGARPAAEMVKRRLRLSGARGLARGPRQATQANPHGLTNRQLETLFLLAEGLHNAEIADRLSTTPKTVEHHVSAVLAKLDARSRAEAVSVAYQLGVLPPVTSPSAKIGDR